MKDFFEGVPAIEPSAMNGFAGNRVDRLSEHRTPTSLADALADPSARLFLLEDDKVLIGDDGALFTRADAGVLGAREADMVLLGWSEEGRPLLVAPVPEAGEDAAIRRVGLRALATDGLVDEAALGALAQGRSLLAWHGRNGHCANCGEPTAISNGGLRRDCERCGVQHFPRIDPVTIMLAIDGDECLLGRSGRFQAKSYSCLAGYLEPGETIEAGVRREVAEESGISIGRVRYHSSQPWPFPSSLMIGCHAEALSRDIVRDEAELEDCRWFSREEVRLMLDQTHPDGLITPRPLAIAHRLIRSWVEAG